MLYDRWREIAREFSPECALCDVATGQRWTFAQLDSMAQTGADQPWVFPQGAAVDFIGAVLRGWKSGVVVCPLEQDQRRPEIPALPKEIVHLKITSATTGPARLVALTAEQLAADARNIVSTMGLTREWPNLGVISLAHSYGFSNLITPLLLHGIPLIVTGSPLPENVRVALGQSHSVTLAGVPALWRAWFAAGVLSDKIRLAISAGAPLSLELERQIFETPGIKVHNFYGSSECGGIAYDRTNVPRTDEGHVGSAMDKVVLKVGDDGCLEVRSEAVAQTYLPQPDERLGRGCFRTSDVAEIIDGAVFLRGRASDLINVAGRKVTPDSIEAVLAGHGRVRHCVVFGVAEADRDKIVACVAAEDGTSADELKQFMLARLPAWQVPRDFWFVPELSPDQRGKLSRATWRKKYLARQGT
jgi:acyl-CoA synthetase (AMP-forming)/AMP-acid ligase II